jgi:outer membrane protein OmpA-like peptidoglycan-associated protein
MTLRAILLGSAFTLACAGTASADRITGWYVGLEGGASWVDEWNNTFNGAAHTAKFETGWLALATVGYSWTSPWRIEFEAGYRDNEIDSYRTTAGVLTASGGTLWEATAMANILYDLSLTDKLSLSLGAGAGGDFSNFELTGTAGLGAAEDDGWNFAYQGIAGVNYMVGRRTALYLNYRYLRVHEPDYRLIYPGPNTRLIAGNDDYEKHAATLGIRYALQPAEAPYVAPPPAPPSPAAPSAPPRQFIVFFGYNKYTLTSEAQRVISEAVTTAKQEGTASILITGHTDTMGTNAYNQRLSVRRANTVRAEMVRQGIANGAITSTGKGESELLVQTADSVKEPQNRRATIDLN